MGGTKKIGSKRENCYLKFVCIGKAKVELFQPWLYLCYTELSATLTQQFVPLSLTSDCADSKYI